MALSTYSHSVPGDSPARYVGKPTNYVLVIEALDLVPNPPVEYVLSCSQYSVLQYTKCMLTISSDMTLNLTGHLKSDIGPNLASNLPSLFMNTSAPRSKFHYVLTRRSRYLKTVQQYAHLKADRCICLTVSVSCVAFSNRVLTQSVRKCTPPMAPRWRILKGKSSWTVELATERMAGENCRSHRIQRPNIMMPMAM